MPVVKFEASKEQLSTVKTKKKRRKKKKKARLDDYEEDGSYYGGATPMRDSDYSESLDKTQTKLAAGEEETFSDEERAKKETHKNELNHQLRKLN